MNSLIRRINRPVGILGAVALVLTSAAAVIAVSVTSPAEAAKPAATVKAIGTLEVDGLEGGISSGKYRGAIAVLRVTNGVSLEATPAGGAAGSGKAIPLPLTVRVPVDTALPGILKDNASGKHIPRVDLVLCRAKDACATSNKYLVIRLTDALVSSTKVHNPGTFGGVATVDVSFSYAKITWTYFQQKADGSLGQSKSTTWDVKLNIVS